MTWQVPFGNIQIGVIARDRINKALDNHWISEGPNVEEFENSFKELFGIKHAIAVSSGTSAVLAACISLYDYGAKRGDEIIMPALSFVATGNAILAAGFTPKFVDIERDTLNIDPNKIEEAVTEKTKAIMVVHTMGKPCEMNTILDIARKYDLKVIEDACEAHGAQYHGNYVGSIGDFGCFSFYTAHVIVAGEGGIVTTNDDHQANLIRSIKSHGRPFNSTYFDFERFGLNLKMNELTAAVGIEGVHYFRETYQTRKISFDCLNNYLEKYNEFVHLPQQAHHEDISPHAFSLVAKHKKIDFKSFYDYLENNGIQVKTLFGCLPTQHKAFEFMGYKKGEFPEAEFVGCNGLHFGIHQYLSEEDRKHLENMVSCGIEKYSSVQPLS